MGLAELQKKIIEKKKELYLRYLEQGASAEVLKISEELDTMICEYHLLNPSEYVGKEILQNFYNIAKKSS